MKAVIKTAGFTLIEMLIYIGLSSGILTAVIMSVYPLFSSSESLTKDMVAETEALFVSQKIQWMLSEAVFVETPSVNATDDALEIKIENGETRRLRIASSTLEISSDDAAYIPITQPHIEVKNFKVSHTHHDDSAMHTLTVTYVINDVEYGPYLYEVYGEK